MYTFLAIPIRNTYIRSCVQVLVHVSVRRVQIYREQCKMPRCNGCQLVDVVCGKEANNTGGMIYHSLVDDRLYCYDSIRSTTLHSREDEVAFQDWCL